VPPEPGLRLASQIAPAVNPDRLRLAREIRGWTQAELRDQMHGALSTAALSQLENGRTRPSGPTLLSISQALEFPLKFFLLREGDTEAPGFFRSLQSTPARARRQALGRAHLLHDLAAAIDRRIRLPQVSILRQLATSHATGEIEELAARVRSEWGLPSGPIINVVRELERHGAVVARFTVDRDDVDGFSAWYPSRPVVVLGEDKGIAARSRFDAAHELGHLVLHGPNRAGARDAEQEAHQFAAAFLMPADHIIDALPTTLDWRRLVDLKAEWGASIAALLRRARDLETMSPHTYVNAMKAMSARGWRKIEPGDELLGAPERPVLIERAIRTLQAQGISLDRLTDEAALPLVEIERLVGFSIDSRPTLEL